MQFYLRMNIASPHANPYITTVTVWLYILLKNELSDAVCQNHSSFLFLGTLTVDKD
jgi:hypothetical protein